MTEQEWLAGTDPTPMLDFLRGKASDRKLRYFAVGCCCRIMRLLTDQRSVNAVLVADRYLDGAASVKNSRRQAGPHGRLTRTPFGPTTTPLLLPCRSPLTTPTTRRTMPLPMLPTQSATNSRREPT